MCSIVGIGFQKGHTVTNDDLIKKITSDLLTNSMSRGETATGVCYTSDKEITIVKDKVNAEQFIRTKTYEKALEKCINFKEKQLFSVLGHCRQKTKGTEDNYANNHPIRYNNTIGIHNGMINNDDEQFEKYKDIIPRKAQVDSEIIFGLIDHFSEKLSSIPEGIKKACSKLTGSYACAMVHAHKPYILWLFRSSNPCTIHHFKNKGLIVFASLPSFIHNATYRYPLGDYERINLKMNTGIGIDLYRNKCQYFDL